MFLRGDCPDGFIDSTLLNEDIGCLNFLDDIPTVSAQAEFLCDDLGTGTESVGGGPVNNAKVQLVEAEDLAKAKDLATLAHLVQKDKAAWWLGLSYHQTATGFAWGSKPETAIDITQFSSIFTPDDPTPSIDNSLCVVMAYPLKWDDISCWQSSFESNPIGVICQCYGDLCPAPPAPTLEPTQPPIADCLGDWLQVPGLGCIQLLVDLAGLTYEGANTACSDVGGYLVEVETAEQIAELKKKEDLLGALYGAETFWVGATDAILENIWYNPVSETSLPSGLIPWYDGTTGGAKQPDGMKSENCLVASLNSAQPGWHDVSCQATEFMGENIIPICMESSASPTSSPTVSPSVSPSAPPFPAGCEYMNGLLSTCYLYVTETSSWTDAEANCASQGGQLASSLTPAENEFIGNSVIQFDSVWLGAKGSGAGGFVWSDLSPWGWTNWKSGEPGTSSTPECVFMSASTWFWSAYDCDYPLGYVCKLTK